SGSPALYRLVRHTPSFSCACGTATAKQGAGRKLAYLAISQTVVGNRASRRASLADTPFHHAWSAARSQCSLTLIPSANLIQSPKCWLDNANTNGISALM